MKRIALAAACILFAAPALADARVETLRCEGAFGDAPLTGVLTQTWVPGYRIWAWAGAFTSPIGENYAFDANGDRTGAFGAATAAGEHPRSIRVRLDAEPGGFTVIDLDSERVGRFECV